MKDYIDLSKTPLYNATGNAKQFMRDIIPRLGKQVFTPYQLSKVLVNEAAFANTRDLQATIRRTLYYLRDEGLVVKQKQKNTWRAK
tara:strand:+ start:731 stop:988 length:258 start_codon:yes stop_codon:yes gene_type:complete